jgi:uncharacterized protein (UPF0333 family)
MKKRGKNKKAQFQISFGMIFSIILIIAFIAVAFYVIRVFLNMKNCGLIGRFYQEVQESVTNAYRSPATSQKISSMLPSSVEYVCVIDLNQNAKGSKSNIYDMLSLVNKNFVIYPKTKCSGFGGTDLTNLNMQGITASENPFCIKVEGGKINLKVEKDIYEKLVRITRA